MSERKVLTSFRIRGDKGLDAQQFITNRLVELQRELTARGYDVFISVDDVLIDGKPEWWNLDKRPSS